MKNNNRWRHFLPSVFAVLPLLSSLIIPSTGMAQTITFEEVGVVSGNGVSIGQIGDMTFYNGTGSWVIDASNLFSAGLDLTHSPKNALALGPLEKHYMQLVGGGLFNLESAYFGVTHPSGNNGFTVEAWRSSSKLFSRNIYDIGQSATLISFGWNDIDRVILSANMYSSGFNVVDDITYSVASVPIPAAFWLFGSGLIGMLGFMRRRKS